MDVDFSRLEVGQREIQGRQLRAKTEALARGRLGGFGQIERLPFFSFVHSMKSTNLNT